MNYVCSLPVYTVGMLPASGGSDSRTTIPTKRACASATECMYGTVYYPPYRVLKGSWRSVDSKNNNEDDGDEDKVKEGGAPFLGPFLLPLILLVGPLPPAIPAR